MIRTLKNKAHLLLALTANIINGFPARKLTVIGVTGTDGKTTTVHLIYHILRKNGYKAAAISTVGAYISEENLDIGFHVTTPSPFLLQKYIKRAVANNNTHLVLEITSHGLDQYRDYGIDYAFGILTNISPEHLDYHKTYDHYVKTKAKLLVKAAKVIINKDDISYKKIRAFLSKKDKKDIITYGLGEDAMINPYTTVLDSHLSGDFNRYNFLAAAAVARELGISDKGIEQAMKTYLPPLGRQDVVFDNGFRVMIDFAHTQNSFKELLSFLAKEKKKRLIHVFGCAGKRDTEKRPEMGKVSAQFSDVIILTAEDPRGEAVESINHDIEKGIQGFTLAQDEKEIDGKRKVYLKTNDRKQAIEMAIRIAEKGDMVIITGKSHEKSMNLDGKHEVPWNEFTIVKEALKKRKQNTKKA